MKIKISNNKDEELENYNSEFFLISRLMGKNEAVLRFYGDFEENLDPENIKLNSENLDKSMMFLLGTLKCILTAIGSTMNKNYLEILAILNEDSELADLEYKGVLH